MNQNKINITNSLGHQPVLDGIRGVAVIAVCGFNFHYSFLQGGFLGVDIFFVLSGFLITTLLIEEWVKSGTVSFHNFFLRRSGRLIPGLFVMISLVLLFTFLFQDRTKALQNAWMGAASLFFVSNWLGVIDGVSATLSIGHTWSLGVEGQFYVLWFILIWFILQNNDDYLKMLTKIAVGIFSCAAIWRLILWFNHANLDRLYLGTDTRFDGVFIGAFAAMLRLRGIGHKIDKLPFCLVLILSGVLVFSMIFAPIKGGWFYAGGFTLFSLIVATLILYCIHNPKSLLGVALSAKPLRWFGKISYSLYLWHLPVGSLLRVNRLQEFGISEIMSRFIQIGVYIAIACTSYYFIEQLGIQWSRRLSFAKASNHR